MRPGRSSVPSSCWYWLQPRARPGHCPGWRGLRSQVPTHLHLIVSAQPPYIYDVDANAVRAVSTTASLDSWVRPSGNGAFVARYGCCAPNAVAFRIHEDGSVQRLASGSSLAPASDSPATWVLRRVSPGHCRLALVPAVRPSVTAPCRPLLGAGEAGVLMWTPNAETLVDTRTGRERARASYIVPVHGDLVFEETGAGTSEDRIGLVDLATGSRRPLRWPSILRSGLSEVVVQPHGDLIAVGFGDPAYPGPAQAMDVWILDAKTGKYTHLPGMPAQVRLKFSSMAWTSDGRRLVLLLEGGGRTVLAVWRPGSHTLPLRPVELPAHTGGSDTFVPLVGR